MSSLFGSISGRTSLTSRKDYKVTVHLLDDNENIVQEFNKNLNGQSVLDYVCDYLNVVEKDYFGLRHQDISRHRYWLDSNKPISKQLRGINLGLRFRVRFYPSNVNVLQEEITRYQLFVQLQRDLLHGRLVCPQNEAAIFGGLIIQSLLGDFDVEERSPDYVSEYKIVLKQTTKLEEKIAEAHKSFKGLTPAEAEMEFLQRASRLDTYGFDPFTVMDKQGKTVYVGVTHRGIFVYQANRMVHHISWEQLESVNFSGKELTIIPTSSYVSPYVAASIGLPNGHSFTSPTKAVPLKYKCPSATFAKHLWRHILSQQAFFTESEAKKIKTKFSKPRIPLLSRGASFRFPTSRVLHEIEVQQPFKREGPLPNFARYPLSKQQPRRSVGDYQTLPPMHFGETINTTIFENEPIMEKTEDWEMARTEEEEMKEESKVPDGQLSPQLVEPVPTEHTEEKPGTAVAVENASALLESEMVPLCASTPLREEYMSNDAKRMTKKEPYEPEMESTTKTNGEPSMLRKSEPPLGQNAVKVNERNLRPWSNALKYFFSCLLVILLIAALAIAYFESDAAVVSYPFVEDIRHTIYEPARDYVVNRFGGF